MTRRAGALCYHAAPDGFGGAIPLTRYPSTPALGVEPLWRAAVPFHCRHVPAALREWLLDRSSLTRRLQARCPRSFRVELLGQVWARPMRSEREALGVRAGQAFIREVRLLCAERPLVFARSVIPCATLRARRHLGRLGSRPLGAVLFADSSMERGELEIACIRAGQRLFARATGGMGGTPDPIWGRRSLFFLGERPLLVQEIFLPGVEERPREGA